MRGTVRVVATVAAKAGWMKIAKPRTAALGAAAVWLALAMAGCGGTVPASQPLSAGRTRATYTVARGDTLYRIASHYGVSVGRLMSANGISDPRDLRVGQTLVIPGAYMAASLDGAPPPSSALHYRGERASRQFAWPVVDGMVTSGFGIRNGVMHDGVDIAAPVGTPVHAADGGTVIFCGRLHGYGNTIIIQHDPHYVTVYGHDEVNLVHEGERVTRGEEIGEIGTTGHTTGANLHFEVRRDNVARNPLAYLPDPPPAAGITFAAGGGS
jgi:murein DD-endopeptidase MepM/ murein hydrolase activator NlpD